MTHSGEAGKGSSRCRSAQSRNCFQSWAYARKVDPARAARKLASAWAMRCARAAPPGRRSGRRESEFGRSEPEAGGMDGMERVKRVPGSREPLSSHESEREES